jgi:hypothetical protein
MKIINQNGYSKDELRSWRIIVYRNLIESAQTLLKAMTDLGLNFDNQLNNVNTSNFFTPPFSERRFFFLLGVRNECEKLQFSPG